jgi:hypothetical protein
MADSCSSSIDSTIINKDKSVRASTTENSSSDDKPNEQRNKRKLSLEEYHQLTETLLEIKQIKCEERLVKEQINRVNIEKQYILNILHTLNSNNRNNTSQHRQRPLQKFQSNSDLN